jgi:hypothetical protein
MKLEMSLSKLKISTFLIVLSVLSCNGGKMDDNKVSFKTLLEVPAAKWEKLSSKKIYFGHQSVGFNILDGIKDIMKGNPQIKLAIIESTDFETHNSGALFHSRVGRNRDPKSKMVDFEKILTSDKSDRIDMAFLKLCYVDIAGNSNPEEIIVDYKDTINNIRKKNMKTKIIHFTSPLTTIQSGIKAFIKKIIGKPLHGVLGNQNRFKYNQLLLSAFSETEPVFDLSEFESTRPDGSKAAFNHDGQDYFTLAQDYTNDGKHLNEYGRKIIAEKLLLFLVNQI